MDCKRFLTIFLAFLALALMSAAIAAAEPTEDTEPPQVQALAIEPTEIDTTLEGRFVTVTAHVTDNLAGSGSPSVSFRSPSGGQTTGTSLSLISGTPTDGIYKGAAFFPQFSESGAWKLNRIVLSDVAGNSGEVRNGEFEELGFPNTVQVKSEEDTEPPQVQALAIEPTEIDTTLEGRFVTVTAHVTDNLAGSGSPSVSFRSPSGGQTTGTSLSLISGTPTDGIYKGAAFFPQFSESGAWKLNRIVLSDVAGNSGEVRNGEFEELGLSNTVVVASQPPVIAEISPTFGPESGGTTVRISGVGFSGATEVMFGSKPAAEFFTDSPTSITAIAPPGAGTVDVVVITPVGMSETSSADRFRYSPVVSLASSPNPSVRGQKVTFTAKVTPQTKGAPKPLGTVAFVEGSTTLGVVSLNSKGIATFSTAALSASEHRVVAEYSGDPYFGPSESPPVAQVVNRAATELALKSSRDPAPFGSSATLSATVKVLPPGTGTPTGTVTFLEGGTPVATVSLSGKVAKYPLKGLPPGTHEFQAVYNGDANYEASESAPLSQTITP